MSRPERTPTLLDLARAAGVSRTSASNAFNRPDQLSAALRARILATAEAIRYPGPNAMARMLRRGQAGAIGVAFDVSLPYAFADPVATDFLRGVAAVCERAAVGLLILPRLPSGAAERLVGEAAVDGFIVHSTAEEGTLLDRVRERHLPFVTVDQAAVEGAPAVGIDDRAAARQVAAHVVGLGHTGVAALAMELHPDGVEGTASEERLRTVTYTVTRLRLLGYRDAMRDHGLDPDGLVVEERINGEEGGYRGALALLDRSPRPTAILAMSDRLAIGALRAAAELGIPVPDGLSVTGFDDIPQAALTRPPLTTVAQPAVRKGEAAAELLLRATGQLDGGAAEGGGGAGGEERVVLETRLVVRGSTGPPPRERPGRRGR